MYVSYSQLQVRRSSEPRAGQVRFCPAPGLKSDDPPRSSIINLDVITNFRRGRRKKNIVFHRTRGQNRQLKKAVESMPELVYQNRSPFSVGSRFAFAPLH